MLYVGTNYHPHDWSEERWATDIKLMKNASFNLVRLGHLCWDSFEPSEGNFQFEWFDKVMDMMAEAGLHVVLDIATSPAPNWLHMKYPDINITDPNGNVQYPHIRYMEDIGHSAYQEYSYRFADKLTQRYAKHRALIAFGHGNEIGAGYISFSHAVRGRFIIWLKNKYDTIEALNKAWATQRWSRRLNSFEDVQLPISGYDRVKGGPETTLDMYRFYSDETIEYIKGLKAITDRNAPGKRIISNFWPDNSDKKASGYDYLRVHKEIIDTPGDGFYPGINPEDKKNLIATCFISRHRKGELSTPLWMLEFQTGSFGGYAPPKKVLRMYAYLTFLLGTQAVCAWTWRTMLGGVEQFLFGLLDHDGLPSRKYYEFKQIAEEFKVLGEYEESISQEPEVAIAYSFDSWRAMLYNPDFYTTPYYDQMIGAYKALFDDNVDCNVIDLRNSHMKYKLVIIPGQCVMDDISANAIRTYVSNGGTVIMTAFSAKVDEHNQAFASTLPGRLSDVFGIRSAAFERPILHVPDNVEGGLKRQKLNVKRENPVIEFEGQIYEPDISIYEILEPSTAEILAVLKKSDEELPAITINSYGKGKAIYLAVPANDTIMKPLLQSFYSGLEVMKGPETPEGVAARVIGLHTVLYVNLTDEEKDITITSEMNGRLSGKSYADSLRLGAYEVEFLETNGFN